MTKLACRYAIVQFMPYSETGEFANVGIVLACPTTGFFGFQLQIRKHRRVTAFFDELMPDVYRTALKMIQGELERVQHIVWELPDTPARADQIRALMDGLTHPREALVRFGATRPLLTADPRAELKRLFDHYVDRAFATQEYVETAIAKRLQVLIAGLTLPAPFKAERIGDDQIHATFPLVQRRDDHLTKIIKPFNLAQDEANAIFDHGSVWARKIQRMRKRHMLPDDVLFAVAAPPRGDVKRFSAYEEVVQELEHVKVRVVPNDAEGVIVHFASE
jgi:hypothetical protein